MEARVTSLDALQNFRAKLILFHHKAHGRLDEVADAIRQTRAWLQHEQRLKWENEIRRRERALGQAEQELFSAKLHNLRENLAREQMAVRSARKAVEEAGEKLRNVKTWTRNFEACFDPLARKLEGLRCDYDLDLPKAVAFLAQAQDTLEKYAEIRAPTQREEPAP